MIPSEELLTPEERTIKRLRESAERLNKAFVELGPQVRAPGELGEAITAWRRSWYDITYKDLGLPDQPAPPREVRRADSFIEGGRRGRRR